jgi:LysR family nitrogen assimilation transcriptional regulator
MEGWLLNREVDVAVLHNPSPLDGVDLVPVLNERMVLVFAPGTEGLNSGRKSIRFRELRDIPLILPSLPHNNRRLLERESVRYGTPLNVALEVDSVPLTKVMVKKGLGATILTFAGVANDVAKGELVAIPVDRPPLISTIGIGSPSEAKVAWLTLELVRMVRNSIAELVESGKWQGAHMIDVESI